MNIQFVPYQVYKNEIPQRGNHILGQQTENAILVYQAYNNSIADFALDHQKFGGSSYSFSRMSWIKPNFLWMMFRSGWAEKLNQERILGIWLSKKGFEEILQEAVYSSYQPEIYLTIENWKSELAAKNVRLQWDPDHDINGTKQERKAIQLGLKSKMLQHYNQNIILEIVDLAEFVKAQKLKIDTKQKDSILVPQETVFIPENKELIDKLNLGN